MTPDQDSRDEGELSDMATFDGEVIESCRRGYETLKDVPTGRLMALNNWTYYQNIRYLRSLRPEVLRAERRSGAALGFLEVLLPKRLRDEDLSDAREVIHQLRIAGAPAWVIYLKALTTGFWCALNAAREVISALTGRSRKS